MICTVGYQLGSPDELVEQLVCADESVVVDVHGNPKRLRRGATSHAECPAMSSAYLAEHPEVRDQSSQLMSSVARTDREACLLCYERHPQDCHRTRLLDAGGPSDGVERLGTEGAPRLLKV